MTRVEEIAAEFSVPADELRQMLSDAREFHDLASGTTDFQQALQQLAERLHAVRQCWETLPRAARILMSYEGPSLNSTEPVTQEPTIHDVAGRLAHLHALAVRRAEEVKEFRERSIGKGRGLQLAGLHTFAEEVKEFWLSHRDSEFSRLFSDSGQPKNEPSRFLWACVEWLNAGYTVKNCDSAMRHTSKGNRPPPELKSNLTPEQKKVAELLLKLGPKPN